MNLYFAPFKGKSYENKMDEFRFLGNCSPMPSLPIKPNLIQYTSMYLRVVLLAPCSVIFIRVSDLPDVVRAMYQT